MEIYNKKDIQLLKDNIDTLLLKVDKKTAESVEPKKTEQDKVVKIVKNFIKEKNRKIYGGYALNQILTNKNPKDAIYSEYQAPDIDFYSPEPLTDLIELVNILHAEGFKNVSGSEAQHKETYSIFVNLHNYVDISYVPNKIYNRMPFIEINNIKYIGPFFIMIDMFRMFTDPLLSSRLWTKALSRLPTLQKYYPIKHINAPLKNIPTIPKNNKNDIKQLLKTTFNFLKNNKSTITIGWYAYNYFVKISQIKNQNIKQIEIPYYEFISTDYVNDAKKLIKLLKDKHPSFADKIGTIEYYPFFQLTGFSVAITFNSVVIAKIYDYNHRCTPFINVKAISFENSDNNDKDMINLASFTFVFLMSMIDIIKYRTDKLDKQMHLHRTILSHLLSMKKYYLKTNNKTILDDTVFKDFIVECEGEIKTLFREKVERIQKNKELKRPYVFKYEPANNKKRTTAPVFSFANSAGTAIRNEKNLKII